MIVEIYMKIHFKFLLPFFIILYYFTGYCSNISVRYSICSYEKFLLINTLLGIILF